MKSKKSQGHPKWMDSGIVIVGNWEPLSFRIRSGFARVEEANIFRDEHSSENLAYAKKLGVSLVITHFHKCFGSDVEKNEIEMTRRYIAEAHRHGLKVGVYIRFDNIADETYASQNPVSSTWIQRNHNGESDRYYDHDFRHRICPNQDGYIQQVEKLVKLAISSLGADLLHLDGFSWGNQFACHCQTCKAGFRKFLAERYPNPESRKRRFGHDLIDKLELPSMSVQEFPDNIINQVHQEWLFFR